MGLFKFISDLVDMGVNLVLGAAEGWIKWKLTIPMPRNEPPKDWGGLWGRGDNDPTINGNTYQPQDPNASIPMFVNGSDKNDFIQGGATDDILYGGNGRDVIVGGGGDDIIIGGNGSERTGTKVIEWGDVLTGGAGRDQFTFTDKYDGSDDTIRDFNSAEDVIYFTGNYEGLSKDNIKIIQDGPDTVITFDIPDPKGGAVITPSVVLKNYKGGHYGHLKTELLNAIVVGHRTKEGTDGADRDLLGSKQNDWLYGKGGNDIIRGDVGNDKLYGGDGDDTMYGGAGKDHLFGGKGSDTLVGGEGEDKFVFSENSPREIIFDFNPNEDKIVLTGDLKNTKLSDLKQKAGDDGKSYILYNDDYSIQILLMGLTKEIPLSNIILDPAIA